MSSDRKVILISGKESGWYEQAIFIVKAECDKMPIDMVKEAENIIKRYLVKSAYGKNMDYDIKAEDIKKENFINKSDIQKSEIRQRQIKKKSKNELFINLALIGSIVMVCILIVMVCQIS